MINVGTQGHNCDTENKPIIGRMPALSSENSDTFWWHKPYLSFWLCLENYLVTIDPHFGTLFPYNFVSWLITHFAGNNIDINYSNLDGENISRATCWTGEFETWINLSLHTGSTGDHLCRFNRQYKGFFWLEGFRIKSSLKSKVKSKLTVHECWVEWIHC